MRGEVSVDCANCGGLVSLLSIWVGGASNADGGWATAGETGIGISGGVVGVLMAVVIGRRLWVERVCWAAVTCASHFSGEG